MKHVKSSAVIVAGGISSRYGEKNKLAEDFLGKTVLQRSVDAFVGLVDEIILVGGFDIDGVKRVEGGNTRFESVKNGLAAVSSDCDVVAVHDGARPFVSRALVRQLLSRVEQNGHSAVPYLPSADAVWSAASQPKPLNKEDVMCIQTPQCYNYRMLMSAFQNATLQNYPDESSLFYEKYGRVDFVKGEFANRKITYLGDCPEYKVGVGFDVHPFGDGSGVILGGVTLPYEKKLVGHSDADVLAHAICDAVLSASGNKDIGHQFPDTDARYKGANSMDLLKTCVQLAEKSGYVTLNVCATVICQQPKIAPYVDAIAANLADVLDVSQSCVNLNATTTERLGALGNGDGIAVEATALLKRIY